MRFAHLHNHTIYSIKDATAKSKDYVETAHEYNNSQEEHQIIAIAATEHGNTFSMVEHHEACQVPDANGNLIKCLYGNEIYHVDDLDNPGFRYHMPIIAKNDEGLRNLFRITTHSGLHKIKSRSKDFQITDLDFIKQHGEGIIALSGCMGGKIGKLIIEGEYEQARDLAIDLDTNIEHFYLEIQPHDMLPEQMLINNALLAINKETGIPLVISTDSHYAKKSDKKYHDLMKEIDHMTPFTVDAHMWTVHELIDWCNKYGVPLEAIENTAIIADMCTADITPKDPRGLMPDYPCPPGFTEDTYLQKLVDQGLKKRLSDNPYIAKDIRVYIRRLQYELDIIIQTGFAGYFLILWDWFKWCKENKILLGPGRGSAAGSLIAYVLDITKIDPIKNGLIMER